MKQNTLLALAVIGGLAAAAFFFLRKKDNETKSGLQGRSARNPFGTGIAVGPLQFGLGASPTQLITAQPRPGASAWASTVATGVNTLGALAAKYWVPNKSVSGAATSGSRQGTFIGSFDSPADRLPQPATTYTLASVSSDADYAIANALPNTIDFEPELY